MKIYTKSGDKGKTSLIGNERVDKNDERVEAYGTLDELNAYLGLIKTLEIPNETKEFIEKIQTTIFDVSAYIACSSEEICKKYSPAKIGVIEEMEKEIDNISEKLPKQFQFSIPANNILSAQINICRTICRRAERCIAAVKEDFHEKEFVLTFVNRLSDYLYALYLRFDA
ncbi:cob(I)yrinic acid a,c-diamide adenosyltransferase [Bacteroidales bacterium OttesenSCG-928-K03]|nr:cob(I)yrinic acid a,c-diamide adenosyltransferase [Bacteroidales bacterium OttesenSCG-928-K22]MDL2242844.1 cob(I)yrinic acid a,c-diamide adenosyltransferase [Bacteroidales bacterium OttesenSCG-928-K03]